MKASVYIAVSLDGFIARQDGSLDWLPGSDPDAEPAADGAAEGEDYGWGAFWDSVDCLVFGRKSFEKVLTFGVWPYEGKRVIVLSRTMTSVPEEAAGKIEIYTGDERALVERLAVEGHERLYIDGGQTIQSFLRQRLITDIALTYIPILIGEGLPLFGPLDADVPLTLVKSDSYANGFVHSLYEVGLQTT